MAVITTLRYQNIADYYSQAQVQISGVSDYYWNAAYEVLTIQSFDPEVDLLSTFYNAYLQSLIVYTQAPAAIVAAVAALQRHVLDKARSDPGIDPDGTADRFSDINDWIDAAASNGSTTTAVGRQNDSDGSFTVPTEFASLSSQAGFPIDAENIA